MRDRTTTNMMQMTIETAGPTYLPPRRATERRSHSTAISTAHVAAVKTAISIMAIVGEFIPLRRQGRVYVGSCPWHSGKSGRSFVVSREHGTFRCWAGCAHGDAVEFIRRYFGLSFPDAIRYLAKKTGIDISRAPSPEMVHRVSEQQVQVEKERQFRADIKAELIRLGKELGDARRLHRWAGERLKEIEGGAPIRFETEREMAWDAMGLAVEELRDAGVGYMVVGFGTDAEKKSWLEHPEQRDSIIATAVARGFVQDGNVRHPAVLA